MCRNPGRLPDGQEIACRKCWQCRNNRVNDWVGRCIAESKTSVACHAITLTYGRDQYGSADHPSAVVLTYSDVQKYFKLLRRHGYPLRYIAVGEYGSKKGRAHWHLIVFWQKKVPPHQLDVRFHHQVERQRKKPKFIGPLQAVKFWPHGVSHWTVPSYEAFRYNVKYILKDMGDDERQGHLAMSKKPPLGTDWVKWRAEQLVDAGLAPRDLFYGFDEARTRTGKKVQFQLSGRTAEIFLEHYVLAWVERRPGRELPFSQLLADFIDPPETDAKFEERMKDRAFEYKWSDQLKLAERIEWARKNLPIAGDWNSLIKRKN